MYHGAVHADLIEGVNYVRKVRPNRILVGVGVSLGAAVLANVNFKFNC